MEIGESHAARATTNAMASQTHISVAHFWVLGARRKIFLSVLPLEKRAAVWISKESPGIKDENVFRLQRAGRVEDERDSDVMDGEKEEGKR